MGVAWLALAYRRHSRAVRELRDWREGRSPGTPSAKRLQRPRFDSPASLAVMALIILGAALVVLFVVSALTRAGA